jgi:hypothetical protein
VGNLPDFDLIEQELSRAASRKASLVMPDSLDSQILQGIQKGRNDRAIGQRRFRRRLWSSVAVCMLLLTCVFTIRISPVFASMVRDIPGMEAFVDLIRNDPDRGLGLALDNDLIQPIGAFDEHNGVRFTVEGIIADESRMVVFYAVENTTGKQALVLDNPNFPEVNIRSLQGSFSYGSPAELQDSNNSNVHRGTIDLQLVNGFSLPKEMTLQTKLRRIDEKRSDNAAETTEKPLFTVRIPIDHTKFEGMKQEYALNQTIEVEGQRVTFVKATVHPLRIAVELKYDESNSKQIFSPGDIHLVDEKGAVWKSYSSIGDVIYFESNYFHQPKELYVEGEWFRALDKEKMEIVVDIGSTKVVKKQQEYFGTLVKAPDSKLKLKQIYNTGEHIKMTFTLSVNHEQDNMGYSLLERKFKDAAGQEHQMADLKGATVMVSSRVGSGTQENYFYLDLKDYKQPLTFQISQYPDYIRQHYKIKIK